MTGAEAIRLVAVPPDPVRPVRWLAGPGAVWPLDALPADAVIGPVAAGDEAALQRLRRLGAGIPGRLVTAGGRELLLGRAGLAFEYLGLTAEAPGAEPADLWRLHPPEAAPALAQRRPVREGCDIGILPLRAPLGGEAMQARARGLTDDIAIGLTRFRDLRVMGRGTLWAWRDSALPGQEIGRRLGLKALLEGSLREADGRLRLDVSLIEVASGRAVWAERWLRDPRGLHGLPDELTERIVAAGVRVLRGVSGEALRRGQPAADPRAGDLVLQARARLDPPSEAGLAEAVALTEAALDLDPTFGPAMRVHARARKLLVRHGWARDPAAMLEGALADAIAAARVDPLDARAFVLQGTLRLMRREHDAAEAAIGTALALNPADAWLMAEAAAVFAHLGRAEEALALIGRAMALDPWYPDAWLMTLGEVHLARRRPDEAVRALLRLQRTEAAGALLVAALAWSGRQVEAEAAAMRLLGAEPGFTIRGWIAARPDRNPADIDHLAEGLRRAGLPWA